MAYSDFTLTQVRRILGIEQHKVDNLFGNQLIEIEPSIFLKADIEDGLSSPMSTEKAKSELIIYPVLKELKRLNPKAFAIFSGYTFNVDESRQLNGMCDFLITLKADIVEPEAPIFCLVEAKNGVIEDGFGQCTAEMVAARISNEQDNKSVDIIYGCVTNAVEWIFLKLEGNTIHIDATKYLIDRLPRLLGVFQNILNQYQDETQGNPTPNTI